jgi:hypothetical protein
VSGRRRRKESAGFIRPVSVFSVGKFRSESLDLTDFTVDQQIPEVQQMGNVSRKVLYRNVLFIGLSVLAVLFFCGGNADAQSSYYSGAPGNCVNCHPASPNTCAGCHAHGVHSSSAKSNINLAADTDKATYAPGETVTVTFSGGYRGGWVRGILYNNAGVEVDRNTGTGSTFPITLTGTAPSTPGNYTFTAAWYGNAYDSGGATFGPNWTPDPGNANHGQEKVATNTFTVSGPSDTTPPTVSSTSPDNNATGVTVGSAVTATFNEPLAPASVTATSFTLKRGVDNVVGTVSASGATATFTPSAPLLDNTTYTATLTTAITDVAGNALAANYVWTFTTAAAGTTPPVVEVSSGGGGGCAISPSGGGNGGILGTYGPLALVAIGIALWRRKRNRQE